MPVSHALLLSYGIEEEFFLVNPETRDLVAAVPKGFMKACRDRFGDRVQDEMQRVVDWLGKTTARESPSDRHRAVA